MHTSIPLVFHPIYSQLTLSKNHRFPIQKYLALKELAKSEHGSNVSIHFVTDKVSKEQLCSIHQTEYVEQFICGALSDKEMKRIGFPWSQQFVNRTLTAIGGTLLAAELATERGIAINLTGGYHHAHPSFGSGFCVFNDLAITASELITSGKANRVLIFDCDVHQGDGTATCVEEHDDIFSLSIHCEKNFPSRKQNSDWDLGLEKALTDDDYLEQVLQALEISVASFRPDFIIYDAGVDVHIDDDLGLLHISTQGILERDRLVFQFAEQHQIPILAVIGGGYQRDISALVQVHMQLIHAASKVFIK